MAANELINKQVKFKVMSNQQNEQIEMEENQQMNQQRKWLHESRKSNIKEEEKTDQESLSEHETDDDTGNSLRYFGRPLKNLQRLRLGGGMNSSISDDSMSVNDQPEDEAYGKEPSKRIKLLQKILRYTQQVFLALLWLTFTYFLMMNKETDYEPIMLTVPVGPEGVVYHLHKEPHGSNLYIKLVGPFTKVSFKFQDIQADHFDNPYLSVVFQEVSKDGLVKTIKSVLHLHLALAKQWQTPKLSNVDKIIENQELNTSEYLYQLKFYSNTQETLALQVAYQFSPITKLYGSIMGLVLLVIIYVHIMTGLVHRTLTGVICCTLGIATLAALNLRPTLEVIFKYWGNIDTIMLFFGISIIMEILSETGLQDHLAAVGYEYSNGHIWPMLNCVLLSSFLLSTVFDDIMLVLFLAPICLRLCEIMYLNSTPVLSCLIIAINLGSSVTPISSISNNLIATSPFVDNDEFGAGVFLLHMLPAALLALAQSYLHLRIQFRDSEKMRTFEPFQVIRLKHLIKVWRQASDRMGDYTLDDRLARKTVGLRIKSLRKRLKRLGKMPMRPSGFEEKVEILQRSFRIRKVPLLVAALVALFVALLFSLLARFPSILDISHGWIAILAALLSLSLCCYEDIEGILSRIDWSTMLFFLSLFIFMQVLIVLGLLENIGLLLENVIVNVSPTYRLTVAILGIIWLSAILTTFLDNVPVADMMMRIIGHIALNRESNLPLMPLVWSLALGCSFGGNGSIVGTFANIACAGVASRHGYNMTFFGYFKIGFFVMIGNIVVASCYLLAVHVGLKWH